MDFPITRQAAEILGVPLSISLRSFMPAQKVGRDWLIQPYDLENFRRRCGNNKLLTEQIK
ncbi:MAG TPA: hypothetical protein PLT26_12630 [Anaerolineaceae bacterium]|nr:hypothetical protein [Anaerolineaceae bacterium]HQH86365.1 hypothetical protein [Anaerolineaceae bacterium]